jgi:hypothetical protein
MTGTTHPRGELHVPRKTQDPVLIALHDKAAKAQAECERLFARLRRAFTMLDKARARLKRLRRRILHHESEKGA